MSYTICSRFKGEHIVYAGYTICTSREHIVYGAFCGSTMLQVTLNEPVNEISTNVVCATSKASYQPAHTRSLSRAFASRLSIL